MIIKVFVSSKINGLKNERKWAKNIIEEEMGLKAIVFEFESASPLHLKKWWRDEIRNSNFYILLLNKGLSFPVFDEFNTAIKYGKKILILIKKGKKLDDLKFGKKISEDQKAFFKRKVSSFKYKEFNNKKELKDNIREGIVKWFEIRDEVDKELWRLIISAEDRESKRIENVYVKPKIFSNLLSKLREKRILIIKGPSHIGKSITATKLALDLKDSLFLDRIIKITLPFDLSRLNYLKNSIIIIDDAFGTSSTKEEIADGIREIVDFSNQNNYFIFTSTRGQYQDIIKDSKIKYNFPIDEHLEELGENSYSDEDLKEILEKHLNFHNINKKTHQFVIGYNEYIIKQLKFPHNIDFFVKFDVEKITDKKSLIEALDRANQIKISVSDWYSKLDYDSKYYLISIALFRRFEEENYNKIIKTMETKRGNFRKINRIVQPYVIDQVIIDKRSTSFRHNSYRNGILQGMVKYDWEKVEKIQLELVRSNKKGRFPMGIILCFRLFAKYDSKKVIKTIKSWLKEEKKVKIFAATLINIISSVKPNEVFPLAKELTKDEDESIKLRGIHSLGRIGKENPKEVLEIFKDMLLNEDKIRIIRTIEDEINNMYSENLNILLFLKEWCETDIKLKINVANALSRFPEKDKNAHDLLRKFLKDTDQDVRNAAVNTLSRFPLYAGWEVFEKWKDDEDSNVRFGILKALKYIEIDMPEDYQFGDEVLDILRKAKRIAEEMKTDINFDVKNLADETVKKLEGRIESANDSIIKSEEYSQEIYERHEEMEFVDHVYSESINILSLILVLLEKKDAKTEIEKIFGIIKKLDDNFHNELKKLFKEDKELFSIGFDIGFAIESIQERYQNLEKDLSSKDIDYDSLDKKYYPRLFVEEGKKIMESLGLLKND